MKHLYIIVTLTLITLASYSQDFYIIQAVNSGNWSEKNIWSAVVRNDGKNLNTIIIPDNITISLTKNEDLSNEGDIVLEIFGVLEIANDKTLTLSNNSIIMLKDGMIDYDAEAKTKKNKSETIVIGTSVKYNSLIDGTLSGNLYASASTSASPMGFSINAVLPVNFVAFNALKVKDDLIAINWTTSDEMNNNHFEIQRSVDGINWKSIAIVLPDTDDANIHMYKYNDKYSFKGTVYYRIRQVDTDGREKYSNVKMIGGAKTGNEILIYVSSKNTVTVELKNSTANNVMVRLINLNGVVVNHKANTPAGEKISLTSSNITPGVYVVQVTDMKGMFTSKKVML